MLRYKEIKFEEIKECSTTLEIFNKLTKLAEVDYYIKKDKDFLDWCLRAIQQSVDNLGKDDPDVKNDLEDILFQLLDEMKKIIEHFDLDPFMLISDRLAYTNLEKGNIKDYYEKIKKTYRNNYIQHFVEKYPIEVFISTEGKDIFKPIKIQDRSDIWLNEFDSFLLDNEDKGGVWCKTIMHFIKKFPDLSKNDKMKCEQFTFEQKLNYPKQIKKYLTLVKKHLGANLTNKSGLQLGDYELYSYFEDMTIFIMRGLYPKLYPTFPDKEDIKIFQKCDFLEWLQPKHFKTIHSMPNLDNYLEAMNNELSLLDKKESPIEKAKIFLSVLNIGNKLAGFGLNIKKVAADDVIDFLTYAVIKFKPERFAEIKLVQLISLPA